MFLTSALCNNSAKCTLYYALASKVPLGTLEWRLPYCITQSPVPSEDAGLPYPLYIRIMECCSQGMTRPSLSPDQTSRPAYCQKTLTRPADLTFPCGLRRGERSDPNLRCSPHTHACTDAAYDLGPGVLGHEGDGNLNKGGTQPTQLL